MNYDEGQEFATQMQQLRQIPCFKNLSQDTIRHLYSNSELEYPRKDQRLYRSGDFLSNVYILMQGQVNVSAAPPRQSLFALPLFLFLFIFIFARVLLSVRVFSLVRGPCGQTVQVRERGSPEGDDGWKTFFLVWACSSEALPASGNGLALITHVLEKVHEGL